MKKIIHIFFISTLLISCKQNSDYSNNSQEEDFDVSEMSIDDNDDAQKYHDITGDYPDGTYCAEIEYYNPNTGTRNTYDLDVDVEDGDMVKIHWANGGWLDETHFIAENISDGECEFTSDKGYRYTVTIGDYGGCGYTDNYKIRNDINEDIESSTCPNCGDNKDSYDDLCYSCNRKKQDKEDQTCPKCGGYKFSTFDETCDNCKDE